MALWAAPASAHAQDSEPKQANKQSQTAQQEAPSPFVGRYDGSEMEMAMGMEIRADGTFGWGLTVGGLDMRASGRWSEDNGTITFVSDPKPVPPRFTGPDVEQAEAAPLVRVVWSTTGEPFDYASIKAVCANGYIATGQVMSEGWNPPEECDRVTSVQLREEIYEVIGAEHAVSDDFAERERQTLVFQFERNDLGVADFEGISGRLENGMLKLSDGRWPMELRKVR